MRSAKLLIVLLPAVIFLTGCDKLNSTEENKEQPNELGGSYNIPMNTAGNTFSSGSVMIGDQYVDIESSAEILSTSNGIATIKFRADLSKSPELSRLLDLIPPQYKSEGKLNANLDFKITSEGIQDFINRDHKAHTIIKYDCNVGDQYNYTKSNGQTISRTVTAKSNADDYPYGLMYIKTTTIEQDSRIPGVKKIVYRANHKFGIVGLEIIMEDGSKLSTPVYADKY